MAMVLVIWTQSYTRIYLCTNKVYYWSSWLYFVFPGFWTSHLALSIKRKVDSSVLTYARKGSSASSPSIAAQGGVSCTIISNSGGLASVDESVGNCIPPCAGDCWCDEISRVAGDSRIPFRMILRIVVFCGVFLIAFGRFACILIGSLGLRGVFEGRTFM